MMMRKVDVECNKGKRESYDMWKERKLIEELKTRQQQAKDKKIKESLVEKISEGRKLMNELAMRTWLKKKQSEAVRKSGFIDSNRVINQPQVQHVTRKASVYSSISVPARPKKSDHSVNLRSDGDRQQIENNFDLDEDGYETISEGAESVHSKSSKHDCSKHSSKATSDTEDVNIKNYNDSYGFDVEATDRMGKILTAELEEYLKNPSQYQVSERVQCNRLSFDEWLAKKNEEQREKKQVQKVMNYLLEKIQVNKRRESEEAVTRWLIDNALQHQFGFKMKQDEWNMFNEQLRKKK